MRLFKISTDEEYKDLFRMTVVTGIKNYMGDNVPIFIDVQEVLDYFYEFGIREQALALYDEYGMPTWDDEKEFLPEGFFNTAIRSRMRDLELTYPFFVVVAGDDIWDRFGTTEVKVFYEFNNTETPNKDAR